VGGVASTLGGGRLVLARNGTYGDRAVTWASSPGHEGLKEPTAKGGTDDGQKGPRCGGDQESSGQDRRSTKQ
jgi:hypothetical protein